MTKKCCSCKRDYGERTGTGGSSVTKKKFYRVPAEVRRALVGPKKRRRTLWLERIFGEIPEKLPKELWICEDHFVSGSPSAVGEIDHPDWAPSQNLRQSVSVELQVNTEEQGLTGPSHPLDDLSPENHQIDVFGEIEVGMSDEQLSPGPGVGSGQHNSPSNAHSSNCGHDSDVDGDEVFFDASDSCVTRDDSDNSVGTQTVKTWKDRGCQTMKLGRGFGTQTDRKTYRTVGSQTELSMHDIDTTEDQLRDTQCKLNAQEINQDWYKDDEVTKYYTGLPNYTVLMAIFELVAPYITYTSRSALTKFQQYALTLMKLRLNLFFTDLGYRFNTSRITAARAFMKCIEVLHCRIKRNVFWPERSILKSTMPADFLESFGDSVTVIIDCFEVSCEKASNLKAKAQTWSNYKHRQTVKYLIAITPQGFICFVSKSYGGRSTDKYITENSGFLNHLHPGDLVMADRGFLIEDSVGLHMAKVVMPAFTKGLSQLSPADVESTRRIANVRIHVERVIGCLRQKYRILTNEIPIRLLNYDDTNIGMDEIVHVCCSLINFAPGIVPLD